MNYLTRRPASLCVFLLLMTAAALLRAQSISLSTKNLSYGNQAITTSVSKSVVLTNTGSAALIITSITKPGAPFTEGDNCPIGGTGLPKHATCTLNVSFSPTIIGSFSGSISIADSATGSPQIIGLSGTGVQPVTLSPTSRSFGKVALGNSSAAQAFTLKNVQNVPLTIYSITPGASFSQTNSCPISPSALPAGGTCSIMVTFSPSSLGAVSGTLSVAHNATGSPVTASLSGTGINPVALSPSSLSFGSQNIGTTGSGRTIQVTNAQPVPLSINSIQVTGDFEETNTCPATLAANTSCPVTVRFSPTAAGTCNGQLLINDGAVGSPQAAGLTGAGIAVLQTIVISPTAATISVGQSTQFTATGTYNDGTSKDITASANWSSSKTSVATVIAGVATGVAAGTATIYASMIGIKSTLAATLTVAGGKITPTITWATPAPITYGTPLSATQLDAAASVAGTFAYSPALGTVLPAGNQTLSVLFTPTDTTHYTTANSSVTIIVNKAVATVVLGSMAQTYTSSALTPTITTVPSGLTITLTGAPDTNAGTYPVTATVSNPNYTGSTSRSFVISPAAVAVTLGNMAQTYTGSALTPTVTTVPAGVTITLTGAPDTNAGTYPVTATVSNPNYTGSASGSFVINPAAVAVTLGSMTQTYTGSALMPTVTTVPSGVTTTLTGAPDTNAGTYAVTATVNNPNYTGSASGSFVINPAALTVALGNLAQTYTGSPLTPTVTTVPAGVSTTLTGAPDTNAGTYPVTATASDPNYTGSASGSFVINPAVTLTSIAVTPSTSSLAIGGTQQFAATGYYSDGSMQTLTATAAWSSSAPGVAAINSGGLATASRIGVTTMTATSSGISGSAALAVAGGGAFVPGGPLPTGLDPFTATLLNDGTVLIAGGFTSAGVTNTASLSDPEGQVFTPIVAPMASYRAYHTATLLNNGMVLLVGGMDNTGAVQSSAELYDPVNKTFTFTGGMSRYRYLHTATLLNDGTVLIAGGLDYYSNAEYTAEIYNPITGTFSPTGYLNNQRYAHSATLLNDGTVLLAGGGTATYPITTIQPDPTAFAELYTPSTGMFTVLNNSMTITRAYHTATLLNDGTVLLAGGVTGSGNYPFPTNSAEIYIPSTQSFVPANSGMNDSRAEHTATLLSNGMVLLVGGATDSTGSFPPYPIGAPVSSADLYDPSTRSFNFAANLAIARSQHTATLLNNGTVLIAGGTTDAGGLNTNGTVTSSTELYQPSSLAPATLLSIAVTPALPPALAPGTNQRFIATGTFSDGSAQQLSSVVWSATDSSGTNVAQISNEPGSRGTVLARNPGTATITATAGVFNSQVTLTVSSLNSIIVTPVNPAIPLGTTQAFTAAGSLADGSPQDLTALVTWSSSSTGVATINTAGLATSATQGSTTIAATFGTTVGTTSLTVGPPALVSIAVPGPNPVQVGGTAQLMAIGTYTDGSSRDLSQTLTPPSWSSNSPVAIIDPVTGLATGEVIGEATISATVGTVFGSTPLYVTNVASPAASSMLTMRYGETATLLGDGRVLVTGGSGAYASGSGLSSGEIYTPVTGGYGTFAATASLPLGVFNHTATLLPSGSVLIAGGQLDYTTANATNQAEVYDPIAGTFAPAAGLTIPRQQHTATLLQSGLVLIAGGYSQNPGDAVNSAELYDPVAGTFTLTLGSLATPRYGHTATLLSDGRVLIVGGYSIAFGEQSTAEIYDPATQMFSAAGSLTAAAGFGSTATLLPNGKVLIAAGINGAGFAPTPSNAAELYDPILGKFTQTGSLTTARYFHTATLEIGGKVLFVGGQVDGNGTPTFTAELYDPSAGTFTPTVALNTARDAHAAVRLGDGSVLIVGGVVSSVLPAPSTSTLSVTPTAEFYPPAP
jgi:uncharacterized protein YjdB